MKKLYALLLVLALLFLPSIVLPSDKPAEKNKQPKEHNVQKTPDSNDGGFDIVLLIDSSGSMKKTDPHDYRKAAAKLFISLLGEHDLISVISFGDKANTLVPLTENLKTNQGKLFQAVNKVTSKEFSTHMHDAVRKGVEELKSSQRKNRLLVLMSDGKLTVGTDEEDKAAFIELSKLIPEVGKANIRLYSIAFSEFSDSKLLEDIAKGTGGFFKFAKEDKDIHVIFSSMFEKIKSPDTIPLEGDTFSIDKDIEEAILVISKKAGTSTTLIAPSGKKYISSKYDKNMKWFGSDIFDMITITGPAVGKWGVKLSTKEGNKIFVITNLSLKNSFNRNFAEKGDKLKIDAWLEKDNGILKEKGLLGEVSFSADIVTPDGKAQKLALSDSGTAGDDKPGDGIYTGELAANITGDYSVKVIAEGKTFKREKVLQFKTIEKPAIKPGQTPAPEKKDAKEEPYVPWEKILVKFGLINLAVFSSVLLFFMVRLVIVKIKTNTQNRKGKK